MVKEVDLLQKKEVREEYMTRLEVLDSVGELLMLPNTEMATVKQVAEYFGVGERAITSLIFDNKDEMESNGYKVYKGGEINVFHVISFKEFTKNRGNYKFTLDNGEELSVGGKGLALFTKRAILNVAMLLRDSEVAKEIRSRLLDIVHDASKSQEGKKSIVENVVTEINEEKQLMLDRIEAEMNGDFDTVCVINAKLFALKNKRIAELEDEVETITTHALTLIESKQIVNRLVRLIAMKEYGGMFGKAWGELYKSINYKLGINVKSRQKKSSQSYFDTLTEEEVFATEQIVRAWANKIGIDVEKEISIA